MPQAPDPWEVCNPALHRRRFKATLFDFDGTLSLFREGWPRIMIGMMLEVLREKGLLREPEADARAHVEDFVMTLNGRPSIFQMERFVEEVQGRGGVAEAPQVYLNEYLDRLMRLVAGRWEQVTGGRATPAEWVVPNAHAILANLQARGVPLTIASGTELAHVRHEADLLQVASFFGPHLYAPADNTPNFSKRGVIERILADDGIEGKDLVGFGDGVTEIQEIKRVGGTAVAVASAEPGDSGVNPWKRTRLIEAGADVVIPDYAAQEGLVAWLFADG